jgi:hypothetical protein
MKNGTFMRLMALAAAALLTLASCGWPPYDIEASSALRSTRDMELVHEFRIDGGTGILQAEGGPFVRFYPSVQFEPQGTSLPLGFFFTDYGLEFLPGQFFDALRGDGGTIGSGTPWSYEDPDTTDNFFGLPRRDGVYAYSEQYDYAGPEGPGDVLVVALPGDGDYNVATVYADPSDGVQTMGERYGAGAVFFRQRSNPSFGPWNLPNVDEIRPIAIGASFDDTLPATHLLGLYIDGPEIRLVQSTLNQVALSDEGIDLDTGSALRDDLDGPAPEYDGDFTVGRLAVRDIYTPGDTTRIAVSLREPDGAYAVFLGRYDGAGMSYSRVEGVTDPVIEVLSNGLLVVDSGSGYELVDASGEPVWSLRSPAVLYVGERLDDGEHYLYFTSGYWGRDDTGSYRITRVHRIPTPEP